MRKGLNIADCKPKLNRTIVFKEKKLACENSNVLEVVNFTLYNTRQVCEK